MIELSASTFGESPQHMRSMIEGARHAAGDLSGALPAVVARFQIQMARRFDQEGAGGPSGAWSDHPLSPRYAAWKERDFPGRKMLELTGDLRESLTSQGSSSVVEYSPNAVFIGSDVEYAAYHQDGTEKMPARPPIDPSDRDVAEWTVEIWRNLERQTSKLGWRGRFSGAMAGV